MSAATMTSNEFVKLLGVFLAESVAFDYFVELLLAISNHHHALGGSILDLARSESSANSAHSRQRVFSSELSEIGASLRAELHTRRVWAGVEELGNRCHALAASPLTREVGEKIGNELSRFSEMYEDFLKSYSESATFSLLDSGNDLYISVDSLRMSAHLAEQALAEPEIEPNETEAELELSFSSSPAFEAFAAKLTALSQMYHKLCELLQVSTATNPLRIVKVETGTWYVKAIGAIAPIALMSRLLENAVNYCYRNYTTEGKLSALPRKAEAAEAILRLKRGLDEAGINTTEIGANIQSAVVSLSQDLNTLIAGENRIVLNNAELTGSHDWVAPQLRDRPLIQDVTPILDESPGTSESGG